MDNLFNNTNVISACSRAQAIEDGTLVDVTDMAKIIGIKWSVAVTQPVWSNYIEWTEADKKRQSHQDQEGRLWDVVYMLSWAMKNNDKHSDIIFYELHILPRDGFSYVARRTKLKAVVVNAVDCSEPAITIMLPDEG
jgi:hypothetical protein